MRAVCVLLLVLIPVLGVTAPDAVTGRVVDEAGAAVAGARVWIIARSLERGEALVLGEAVTDAAGAFSVGGIEAETLSGDAAPPQAVAYREGLALGWEELPKQPGEQEELLITCLPPITCTGRLVDGEGKGLPAEVMPRFFWFRDNAAARGGYLSMDGQLATILAVRTDADGRFAISLCPKGATLRLDARSDAFGTVALGDSGEDQGDVVILAPGALHVRVACDADPQATRGLFLHVSSGGEGSEVYSRAEATTGDDGTVLLPHVLPGAARVLVRFAHDAPWQCGAATAQVNSGQTTEVEVTLQMAYEVTGRVVDAASGEPVADARVAVAGPQARYSQDPPPTDAQGAYRAFVLPGQSGVYVTGAPDGYMQPDLGETAVSVTVTDKAVAAPDIALTPATALEGVVVDAEGSPVPRALVYGVSYFTNDAIECDAEGRFHIAVAKVQGPTDAGSVPRTQQLWARSGDRMTREPLVLAVGREGPVKLVIEEGVGCSLALRAVDGDGQPVADAEVAVQWMTASMGIILCTGRTGADGSYTGEALWPFGSYSATISKPAHRQASSAQWEAAVGQVHDLGTVAMVKAAGLVAGHVVDAGGKPVAGARVTANSEGPGALTTQTDAAGAFKLAGLYEGAVWVIARAGDTIGGARLLTGTEDGTIALSPLLPDVPLGEPRPCGSCTDRETDRQVARELLEELAASATEDDAYSLAKCWAKLDPQRAFELAAGKGSEVEQTVLQTLAEKLLTEDPQEALNCIEGIGSQAMRAYCLAEAAGRLRQTHPDLAAEAAQWAVTEGRSIADATDQAIYLGRAAEALYGIDPEAAEPVLRELQSLGQKLGYDERASYARGCVAEALCRLDLDGALALLADITDGNEATRHQPNIAARIAATQPEKARDLMAAVSDWQRGYEMPRIAYAMAPAHPDMALELARGIDDPGLKARSLGYAALALAKPGPQRAAAVLREAVEIVAAGSADASPNGPTDLGAVCGELALIAAQMGCPAVDGLCWLALSMRAPESQDPWGHEQGCAYLRGLSLANPPLAADLVRDLLAQPGSLEGEPYTDHLRDLATAAAVCDARAAVEVLRALDARSLAEKRAEYRRLWLQSIDCLLAEPEDRPAELLGTYGNWVPGARGVD